MMKKGILLVITLFGLTTLLYSQVKLHPRVSEIWDHREKYVNEVVQIEGYVTHFTDENKTTQFYLLKDDWGGLMQVRTSQGSLEVGKRYRVVGVVSVGPENNGTPYIAEDRREEIGGTEWEWRSILLIAGIVALVAILVTTILILVRQNRRKNAGEVAGQTAQSTVPPQGQVLASKTIRMHVPPPGTLKLLPGRFEVLNGDSIKEIRFYKMKDFPNFEMTFGRASGPPYRHIQLTPQTVSGRQAKLAFNNGHYYLINYAGADSNPTRVNGKEMAAEESAILQPSDLISMGEVEFRFMEN